jgi:hypothetical protein
MTAQSTDEIEVVETFEPITDQDRERYASEFATDFPHLASLLAGKA